MNSRKSGYRRVLVWALAGWVGSVAGPGRAQPEPYAADAHTLHLWHFDEPQNDIGTLPEFYAFEASTGFGFFDLSLENGAKLEAPSFSAALAGALDTRGIPGSAPLQAGAFGFEDLFYLSDLVGGGGAFTFEALVSPDFDPSAPVPGRAAAMHIVSMENEGDLENRMFQFRLAPPASNEQWAVQFANMGSAPPGTTVVSVVEVIDDFADGDLSAYTQTLILDQNATNDINFQSTSGALQVTKAAGTEAEQVLLLRDDYQLAVGQLLRVDLDYTGTTRADIGIAVAATATPTPLVYDSEAGGTQDVREDYAAVYVQADGDNLKGLFVDGTTVGSTIFAEGFGSLAAGEVQGLYIRRYSVTNFALGFVTAAGYIDFAEASLSNPEIGNAVGFIGDVRSVTTFGDLDNLRLESVEVEIPPGEPEFFSAPLPVAGPDAAVQGGWYHVAVTYNGLENTDGNLRMYWTDLARGASQAAVLGSFRMSNDLGSASVGDPTGDFSIGNEGRDAPGEAFFGFIDEVRVSGIARAPFAFNLTGAPYAADPNTRLLYHLDEANPAGFPTSLINDAFDTGAGDPVQLTVRDGAVFEAPAFSAAFGTALDTSVAATAGAFAPEDLPLTSFLNETTGAFTFEALVNLGFDPAATTVAADGASQILSMDDDGGRTERPMQFRLVPPETAGGPINLEFVNIAAPSADLHFLSPLPATGPHAPVQGDWYHVAVAYTGDTAATNNLVMYWTALQSGATTANMLGTHTMAARLAGASGDFVVGNEGRSTGGATDNFLGLIDEVRISSVARSASQFLMSDLVAMPEIGAVAVDWGAGTVGLTWSSEAGVAYRISRTGDLVTFTPAKTGIIATGTETADTVPTGGNNVGLFRIEVE